MGMKKTLALYMQIKPGEFANYPNGKNDHAHIRDTGALWFAKAAVILAREQGLALAEFFK